MRWLLLTLLLMFPTHSWAQGAIQQSGPVVVGHVACWAGNGLEFDCGKSPTSLQTPLIRVIAAGLTDTVVASDGPLGTVAWNSATTGAKTERLLGCVTLYKGYVITIVDEKGTASTYPITIVPITGTINGTNSWPIYNSYGAFTFTCDGVSNWIVN